MTETMLEKTTAVTEKMMYEVETVLPNCCLVDVKCCKVETTKRQEGNWKYMNEAAEKNNGLFSFLIIHTHTFMIPFQLSPVATRNSVRNAIPKLWK